MSILLTQRNSIQMPTAPPKLVLLGWALLTFTAKIVLWARFVRYRNGFTIRTPSISVASCMSSGITGARECRRDQSANRESRPNLTSN